jgi:uncharacterized membrane protein
MKNSKKIIKIILIISLSYLFSFLLYNFNVLKNRNVGNIDIENGNINFENIKCDNDGCESSNQNSNFEVSFDNPYYINKFDFNYNIQNPVNWTMKIRYFDYYGNISEKSISGTMFDKINVFSEPLNAKILSMKISFDGNVNLNRFYVNNNINYFPRVFIVLIGIEITILLLIKNKRLIKTNLEFLFLIIALVGGSTEIILTPVGSGISWDDEIHFANVYNMFNKLDSDSTIALKNHYINIFDKINTVEEEKAYVDYLNTHNSEKYLVDGNYSFNFSKIVYVPQAILFKLLNIVNLPIVISFIICKFLNLILYTILIFYAIRKTPIGKHLMLIIALIPTSVFMASNYSYDPPITSLILLSMSLFLNEYLGNNKKINVNNILISVVCMTVACCPKAVYTPLLLFYMLIPQERFESKKSSIFFKFLIIFLLLLMMSTFILPTLTTNVGGDPRGGNTSVSGQMKNIINSPLSYIYILKDNAWNQFLFKFFGTDTITLMAYLPVAKSNNIYYLFIIVFMYCLFHFREKVSLNKNYNILCFILCFGIILLIWTALYLSFTPVGSLSINGVQSRYFIPLLFPILINFLPKSKSNFDNYDNSKLLIFSLMLIMFCPIYNCVLASLY